MATPPLLDFDALIAPIPGENPAGDPVPFELRQQLDEARRETNPEDVQPDEMKRADWGDIIRTTQAILTQTSKDLLTAARLTEALTKEYGFAGARDGLHLLTLLLDQCWDRLNPPIEDNDLEPRVTPFSWLDDPGRGARFPSTLRLVPIIVDKGNSLEWNSAGKNGARRRTARARYPSKIWKRRFRRPMRSSAISLSRTSRKVLKRLIS
jgi:type VI secretion system protein ImpA